MINFWIANVCNSIENTTRISIIIYCITVTGIINILPATTNIDLNLVLPSISSCDKVIINVVGGSSALISSITNWPSGLKLTFSTSVGQAVTFQHTDYDVAGLGDIVIEDGQNMTLNGRIIGNEYR